MTSAHSNLSNSNFCKKIKMHKFGIKNAFFGYFWSWILKKLLLYFKWAPSNMSNCKNSLKKKCLHLGPKMLHLGTKSASLGDFWAGIWKQYCRIWSQYPYVSLKKTMVICKISTLKSVNLRNFFLKISKFRAKNASFQWEKCFIWVFLGLNLKTIVIFEVSTVNFV